MKKFLFLLRKLTLIQSIIVLQLGMCISLSSCSNDDDINLITGTWYGTRVYNNAGSIKYQYLTIQFYSDGWGSLEYESPVSYATAQFTYSVKNSVITCKGASANTYGDIEGDFTMKLKIEGNRLIPLDKYTLFILTQDSSVMTDGDGNEVIDNSSLLYGVWVQSSGTKVLVLDQSSYTEYTRQSASSSIYSSKTQGTFSYNVLNGYVLIDGYTYYVTALSETVLQLKSQSNVIYNYTRGSTSDIPSDGSNSTDYKSILETATMGWATKNSGVTIHFYNSNQIHYLETSSKSLGSFGYIALDARGTYSLSGTTINCYFTDVSWQSGASTAKDYFPGWTYGQACKKQFTIVSANIDVLTLKRDGKTYILYNLLTM